MYAVFEGLGMNAGYFIDFIKVYMSIAVLGNSCITTSPIRVLE
jgi:hypothetical protein